MKNIPRHFISFSNMVLAALIGILGYSTSCNKKFNGDFDTPEYGVPVAKFIINGKVESVANNQAIAGIQVVAEYDTSHTYLSGNYAKTLYADTYENGSILLQFKDIDGAKNGEFMPLDTFIQYKVSEFEGGDDYFDGGTAVRTVNIKLQPKDERK